MASSKTAAQVVGFLRAINEGKCVWRKCDIQFKSKLFFKNWSIMFELPLRWQKKHIDVSFFWIYLHNINQSPYVSLIMQLGWKSQHFRRFRNGEVISAEDYVRWELIYRTRMFKSKLASFPCRCFKTVKRKFEKVAQLTGKTRTIIR